MVDKAIVEFARVVEEQHVLPGSPFDGGDSMLRDRVSVLGFAGNTIGGAHVCVCHSSPPYHCRRSSDFVFGGSTSFGAQEPARMAVGDGGTLFNSTGMGQKGLVTRLL